MSKVTKYLTKYREYMRLDQNSQESDRGDALWDKLNKMWNRMSSEDRDHVCDTLERDCEKTDKDIQ